MNKPEIRRFNLHNLIIFILKTIAMLVLNSLLITFLNDIKFIVSLITWIVIAIYIVSNIYILLLSKKESIIKKLNIIYGIIAFVLLISLVVVYIWFNTLDPVEVASHGFIITSPIQLLILYCIIAIILDVKIIKYNKEKDKKDIETLLK